MTERTSAGQLSEFEREKDRHHKKKKEGKGGVINNKSQAVAATAVGVSWLTAGIMTGGLVVAGTMVAAGVTVGSMGGEQKKGCTLQIELSRAVEKQNPMYILSWLACVLAASNRGIGELWSEQRDSKVLCLVSHLSHSTVRWMDGSQRITLTVRFPFLVCAVLLICLL